MSDARTINVLNRLLAIQSRSLPMYLTFAALETRPGDDRALEALKHIVADQRVMSGRIVEAIENRGGAPNFGGYPMEFTDTHMLSLDFLLRDLIRWQKFDVQRIEGLVRDATDDRAARELVQEALGAARAHLEALQELVPQPA